MDEEDMTYILAEGCLRTKARGFYAENWAKTIERGRLTLTNILTGETFVIRVEKVKRDV